LSSSFLTKYLTVVDDDIDIGNPEEIEWAIVSRPQADRDVLIVPDLYGNPLDPSCTGALGAKMGIDATKSLNIPAERFELSDVPKDIRDRVERDWEGYF
jgi:2,5-furandicarboxylate decarboxylase 1